MRIIGAHNVGTRHLWSVTRVRGISASFLALGLGLWILLRQDHLARTPAGEILFEAINGQVGWAGVPVLVGGICGVVGLFTRIKAFSIASCVICLLWFGWVGGFLWYADLTGERPNIAAFFCIYGFLEYAYRFILLISPVEPGEEYGKGW
jgi:hypothetical protein